MRKVTMTSDKQLKANQENAQLSTGPKTEAGKAVVSQNAKKHGILSNELVISTPELQECQEDYDQLLGALNNDYSPVGTVEEILVERIAISYWRLRRVLRAEKGEIRKRSDNVVFKNELARIQKAESYRDNPILYPLSERLMNRASAIGHKSKLEEMKKQLEYHGYMPKQLFDQYVELMGSWKDKDGFSWVMFFNEIAQGKVEGESKEKGLKALLFLIDKDIEHATTSIELDVDLEKDENEAIVCASSLADSESMEKLQRYETMLENQMYRAINQLTKLQVLRMGGKVASLQSADMEVVEM